MHQRLQARLLLLAAAALSIAMVAEAQTIPRLNVCPNALYLKVPFLNSPVDASYFANIKGWKMEQISTYLRDRVLPRVATSIAFLAIAIIAFIIFVLWRLFRCCCNLCCKKEDDPEAYNPEPVALISGPMVTVIKLLVIVATLGGVALCGVGIGTANKIGPAPAFTAVNLLVDYGKLVAGRMTTVLARVQDLYPISYSMVQASASPTMPAQQSSALVTASSQLNSSVLSVFGSYNPNIQSLNSSINSSADSIKTTDNMYSQYNKLVVQALQGLYAGTLGLLLLLALFVIIHCPFGIAFTIALCFLVAVLHFLLGAVLALGLIAGSDVCPNLEPIISTIAPTKYLPVLSYYLNYTEPTTNLETVLAQSNLINVADIRTQAFDSATTASSTMTTLAATVPPSDAATLNSIRTSIDATITSINASIGSSSGASASGLLGAAGYRAVNDVYVGFKVSICCTMVDQVVGQWAMVTALGWMVMLTSMFAISMLRRLDQLPQGGTCCACRMLTPGKVQAAQDESAAASGKDNHHGSGPEMQAPAPMTPMYYPAAVQQPYPQQQQQPYYYAQPVGATPPPEGMTQARSLTPDANAGGAEARERAVTPPVELPPRRSNPDMSIPNVTVPAITVPSIAGLDAPALPVTPPLAAGQGVAQHQEAHLAPEASGSAPNRVSNPGAGTAPTPVVRSGTGGSTLF